MEKQYVIASVFLPSYDVSISKNSNPLTEEANSEFIYYIAETIYKKFKLQCDKSIEELIKKDDDTTVIIDKDHYLEKTNNCSDIKVLFYKKELRKGYIYNTSVTKPVYIFSMNYIKNVDVSVQTIEPVSTHVDVDTPGEILIEEPFIGPLQEETNSEQIYNITEELKNIDINNILKPTPSRPKPDYRTEFQKELETTLRRRKTKFKKFKR